ncbi:uncharacterized protein BP5553_01734 [Venustampulla echinocandica]|uniref:Uncharacterized protein n=1 Tax=Venustampulla echinocandica TaxID=2656787 RepID=A0A370U1W7_9HELO|nr:uncharacterized protein BP5553_01734 [Venustampulla echinocandica]RDL41755.1 hypothetical protein BP5553_01734 [Venustampulla echinocandica]
MAGTRSITKLQARQRPLTIACTGSKEIDIQTSSLTLSNDIMIMDGAEGKAFKSLSLELHQLIMEFLPNDSDVAKYARICHAASAAVTTSVWRKRFLRKYDYSDGETNQSLFKKYKYRHIVSNEVTIFNLKQYAGRISNEARETQLFNQKNWLDLLRTLIIESDAKRVVHEGGRETIEGRNIKFIRDMTSDTGNGTYIDIIDAVLNTESHFDVKDIVSAKEDGTLAFVVQLILTPISLHPDFCNAKVSHFDLSQAQTYATSEAQPIFTGKFMQNVNVLWLLNVVNFFKFHLKTVGEGLLSHAYNFLPSDQYPQTWIGRIKAGTQPLGSFWKGCHMYMDESELFKLRNHRGQDSGIYSDSLDLGETFQDIEISFDEKQFSSKVWPPAFEGSIPSDPFRSTTSPPACRRSRRNMPTAPEILNFYGISDGDKTGYFYGRIHGIPHQQGFHGFQRITFVMFYYPKPGAVDSQIAYSYEGCVLPGGRCIVGRWWGFYDDPKDVATMSGPFIWWNVDRGAIDGCYDRTDPIKFLQNYL